MVAPAKFPNGCRLLQASIPHNLTHGSALRVPRLYVCMIAVAVASTLPATGASAAQGGNQAGQSIANTPKAVPPSLPPHSLNCPAKFITALVPDGHGGAWAASEDSGIYHWNAAAKSWRAYNTDSSPGLVSNRIYSLAIDYQGRLWVGMDRHGGVSEAGHRCVRGGECHGQS